MLHLFQTKGKRTLILRHYDDGSNFIILFPDGTGNILYPFCAFGHSLEWYFLLVGCHMIEMFLHTSGVFFLSITFETCTKGCN